MDKQNIAGLLVKISPYSKRLDTVSIADRAKMYFGTGGGGTKEALYVENYLILKKFTDMEEEELRDAAWRITEGGEFDERPDKVIGVPKEDNKLQVRFIKFLIHNQNKEWIPMRECIMVEAVHSKLTYGDYFDKIVLENDIGHRVSNKKYKHSIWVEINKSDYVNYVTKKYEIPMPRFDI